MFRGFVLAITVVAPTAAQTEVNRLRDLPAAITACWHPPPSLERLEATIRFSLNRQGAIMGSPAITFSALGNDELANREFIASVLGALQQCTPVNLTDAFADAVAGRPVTIRFLWDTRRKWLEEQL